MIATAHPSYLRHRDLAEVSRILKKKLSPCELCPFRCGAERARGRLGRCRSGYLPKIASATLHSGEEPPISGERGSGTIFFSGCPLRCAFCQNYPISQYCNGNEISEEELAGEMLELQVKGAHNINLVTPTHFVPQIVSAIRIAADRGLRMPIVYNSGGYEDVEVLKLLEGIVDIYLPDMKYGDDENALKYSGVPHYTAVNRAAIREMFRQVGEPVFGEDGIMIRGLVIRHLVLPYGLSSTERVLEFIASLSRGIGISLMGQYFPAHRALSIPELMRKITPREYETALELLDRYGLENGWFQYDSDAF